MKNSTKLKLALLKEFGHQAGDIEDDIASKFPKRKEDSVHIGMHDYYPHREEQEYGMCQECGIPAMYEGKCQECGYLEEGEDTVFMVKKTLEHILDNVNELLEKVHSGEEIPAWIVNHITKSGTFLDEAADGFYLDNDEPHEEPEHNDDMSLDQMFENIKRKKKKKFKNSYTKNK